MQQRYDWEWIERQAAQTAAVWKACKTARFAADAGFTVEQQKEREDAYDLALNAVEAELCLRGTSGGERDAMRERVVSAFGLFAATALDLNHEAIEILTREFLPVGTALAQWARRFDSGLGMSEIIQACRNAWTACGLQPLMGERIALTPAIFGYSLLYPYSDNYLDDGSISVEAKVTFSKRFRRQLCGEPIPASNAREGSVQHLIRLVELQFPRDKFPNVYSCLLAIHRAQEQSMRQIMPANAFNEDETLRLSCEKGGSSVLADVCLARGWMTEQEARFAFEWGVLLQLGDDLQDVREDLQRGSMTLFSHPAYTGEPLEIRTLQLLAFAEHVGTQMDRLPHGSATFKDLLKMSWRSLIIRAIADSHEFFSPAFVRQAETYSPFRFEFLRKRQDRIAARHGLYAGLFEAFLDEDAPESRIIPTPLAHLQQIGP
jgi:hypothetical protein